MVIEKESAILMEDSLIEVKQIKNEINYRLGLDIFIVLV